MDFLFEKLGPLSLVDIIFMIGALLAVMYTIKLGRKDAAFHISDTLTGDNGRVSGTKVSMMVAMYVTTWGFIHLTLKDMLTEWYFAAYMLAWAGVNLGNKALGRDQVVSVTSEKTTTTTANTKSLPVVAIPPGVVPVVVTPAPTQATADAVVHAQAEEIEKAAANIQSITDPKK